MLIHDSTHFLQLLEGPWSATADTLLRIVGDHRHSDVTVFVREPTEVRLFSNWDLERLELPADEGGLLDRVRPILMMPHSDRGAGLRLFALTLERTASRSDWVYGALPPPSCRC